MQPLGIICVEFDEYCLNLGLLLKYIVQQDTGNAGP